MSYSGTLTASKPTVFPNGVQAIVVGSSGVQQTAIVSLTDNTAGTANDTLAAIPDPADSPATADALRDDLVANTLPPLRNDLADLAAKVNAILAALRGAGIIAT